MGLTMIYLFTKFDISSFTHSKFMKGIKIKDIDPLDPDHAHLWYFIILASPVANLGNGF